MSKGVKRSDSVLDYISLRISRLHWFDNQTLCSYNRAINKQKIKLIVFTSFKLNLQNSK